MGYNTICFFFILTIFSIIRAIEPIIYLVATVGGLILIDLLSWKMVVHDAVLIGLTIIEHIHHITTLHVRYAIAILLIHQEIGSVTHLLMLLLMFILTVTHLWIFLITHVHTKFSAIIHWSFGDMCLKWGVSVASTILYLWIPTWISSSFSLVFRLVSLLPAHLLSPHVFFSLFVIYLPAKFF